MSWYVKKTSKPLTFDHTVYYSFEHSEAPGRTYKKPTQIQNQSNPQKQEKKQPPKKRKEAPPTDSPKPAKKRKTVEITEASFI